MKQMKHWQDPVNALLGAWLILSPWAVGFADQQAAMINFLAVGVLLIAVALGAIFVPQAWEEWSEVILGVWLIASPWIIGFTDTALAMQNAVLVGLMVTVLALWVLAVDKEYGGWWSDLRDSTKIP